MTSTQSERIDFDTVWEYGLSLAGAKKIRYYGMAAVGVRDTMFACKAGNPTAEPKTLIAPVGFTRRARRIASNPDVYYLKPHYESYPVVLVRLTRITRPALQRLLRLTHRLVSTGAVNPDARRPLAARTRTATTRTATKRATTRRATTRVGTRHAT